MFRFKQFTIHQQKCAMKVGTDGVLLGAWADVEQAKKILDIGTGTGLIALMLAQRTQNATIDAVEIDADACNEAGKNVNNSPWANKVNIINQSLQTYTVQKQYDLIVSNPPYFSNSLKNPDKSRTIARHTDTLSLTELFSHAARLLLPNGSFCLIFPYDGLKQILYEAQQHNMFCSNFTKVFPKLNALPKRALLKFVFGEAPYIENDLYIEETARHEYSNQYKELTKDFYLNF